MASTYTKFNVTTASDGRKKHRNPHHSAILHSGVVWSRYSNTTKDSFFVLVANAVAATASPLSHSSTKGSRGRK